VELEGFLGPKLTFNRQLKLSMTRIIIARIQVICAMRRPEDDVVDALQQAAQWIASASLFELRQTNRCARNDGRSGAISFTRSSAPLPAA